MSCLHRFDLKLPVLVGALFVPGALDAVSSTSSRPCTLSQLTDNPHLGLGSLEVDFSGHRIVFEASVLSPENPDGGVEIFVVERRMGVLRQVSHVNFPPNLARYPTITGDGRRVAYQVDGSTPIDWFAVLYLHDLTTNAVTPLSPTNWPTNFSATLNGDGSRLVFESSENLSGDSPYGHEEVFLYDADAGAFTKITPLGGALNERLRIDFAGHRVVFDSIDNLTGENPNGWPQLFVFDGKRGTLGQITPGDGFPNYNLPDLSGDGSRVVFGYDSSLVAFDIARKAIVPLLEGVPAGTLATNYDGTRTAFFSSEDLIGENPDESVEVFLYDSAADQLIQVTDTDFNSSFKLDINGPGNVLVFLSNADLVGQNPDRSTELFAAECHLGPPRPETPALRSSLLPDFAFHVRFSSGDGLAIDGQVEPDCIAETVCVRGAVPGRSEVFLRVVGPKPNGFLWPTLVKFSTSTVEVWVEQLSTGLVRFYRLEGASPGKDELPGLFDRNGFLLPPDAEAGEAPSFSLAKGAPIPPGEYFTSPHFPDFRFRARVSAGNQLQEVRQEPACIEETLCLSGAVPGRSEMFLRLVGPKPNGRLWPTIVKFTTSTLEVWIEQVSTGETKYYRIEGAAPGKDDLTGLFDRAGFAP